ncbi:TrkH family potassium uptake protein [Deinococcus sp. UYEF24]
MTRPASRPLLSRFSAPQLIALSFAVTILLGGLLLSLPLAHAPGQEVSLLSALFMATSALCVTGLALFDLDTFSLGGQIVLLLLIQLGGLGIITFGTVFAFLAHRRLAFSERTRLAQQVSSFDVGSVMGLIRNIFLYTAVIETLGTAVLACRFVPQFGWGQGLYASVYHSVMAFNNAGFPFFRGGLMDYTRDPLVSLTIAALVILGGMGFLVQLNVVAHLRKPRQHRMLVHSKIALSTMTALLLLGTVLFAVFEWNNPATLGPLPTQGKLLASFFGGVTPRTAGFNALNYELMRPATLLLTIALMFVGANSGSTGGGIKTGTLYVMLASAWNMIRGRGELVAFERRVPQETVLRALTVALLSTLLVNVAFLLLLALNTNPRLSFLHLFFETVSAFGSVGLSMNATPDTNAAQRVLLMVLMFLGRIGPLTFAVAISGRPRPQDVSYPPERDILIG